jgi:chromosome partitioning protein
MFSVAFISTKGGAGKSTAAAHFAVAAAGSGRNVLVLDCDSAQTSIAVWADALRAEPGPGIRAATHDTFPRQLMEAARERIDLVVVDVPPGGGALVTRVASLVNLVLIPVKATTFDLHAMRHTVDLLRVTVDDTEPEALACRNALGKAAIVLNGTPPRPTASWRADIEGALAQCGAGALEILGALGERAAYRTSLESGLGVTEEGRDAKAVAEVMELHRNVLALERKRAAALRKLKGRT